MRKPPYITDDANLALVAGAWKAYCMLQGLVNAGVVNPYWASKSLHNVIQYTYRQAVCRVIAAYTEKRIIDTDAETFKEIWQQITTAFGIPENFFNDDTRSNDQ